jgi:DNA-binding transcriptional MerR regulator
MKEPELDPDKLFFSIGEVSAMFGVNASLIRFWEKEFDIIRPKKNKKGNRLFTREDVKNFHLIYHLVKEKGFTLPGARQKLSGKHEALAESHELVLKLQKVRAFLVNIKKQLSD